MLKRSDFEIMAPVGSWESLAAALNAGADSVYFGIEKLNMRSHSSSNFTGDDLREIVARCNEKGVKTYLTVNTVLYDNDLEHMRQIVDVAKDAGVSAIIAADVAAMQYACSQGVEVHLSTQLNIANVEALKFYAQFADVVVLARELNLDQVKHIYDAIQSEQIKGKNGELVRIEMFCHGALCMAVSGKCYLSEHEEHCSANRGACRQICRRKYQITDMQTGRELAIDGRYVLSPKDLCTVDFLDKFINAGVSVLKIEGRARGAEYVKRVVECYDLALKAIERGEYSREYAEELKVTLSKVFNRGFWGGYYAGAKVVEHSTNYGSSATRRKVYVGKVTNYFKRLGVAEVLIEAAQLSVGEPILWMGETTGVEEMRAEGLVLEEKVVQHIPQGVYCSIKVPQRLRRGDKLYKMVPSEEVDKPIPNA